MRWPAYTVKLASVVVCKEKIWLAVVAGKLAVVIAGRADGGIGGGGKLGRITKQKDIYIYARERDVTQNITQKPEIDFKAPKRRF